MDTKSWAKSKTVWGGIAAVIAGILKGRNIDISDLLPSLFNNLDAVLAFSGGLVAIYGRIRAAKLIAPKADTSTIGGGPRLPLVILGALCASVLFAGCTPSSISASYTDPKTGTTYYGGTHAATPVTADPKG